MKKKNDNLIYLVAGAVVLGITALALVSKKKEEQPLRLFFFFICCLINPQSEKIKQSNKMWLILVSYR